MQALDRTNGSGIVSLPQLKRPGYTLEDWQSWEGRWELIHGQAFDMTPAPSTEHQEISSNLHARISPRGIEGALDLVVEILSPSTAGKDVTRKWWLYEAAGVQEYLIVDPAERVGRLLHLVAGRFEEAARVEWGASVALLRGRLEITLG